MLTEAQWSTCRFPDVLLRQFGGRTAPRGLRLFAAACCRRVWDHVVDARSQAAVDLVERLAEGQAAESERLDAQQAALAALEALSRSSAPAERLAAAQAAFRATHRLPFHAAQWAAYWSAKSGGRGERGVQAMLFRDVAGNPFRRPAAPAFVPGSVAQLARALRDGTDCVAPLHDALLDAGLTELAEHFRQPLHARGCWAVELLLPRDRP